MESLTSLVKRASLSDTCFPSVLLKANLPPANSLEKLSKIEFLFNSNNICLSLKALAKTSSPDSARASAIFLFNLPDRFLRTPCLVPTDACSNKSTAFFKV